MSRHRDASSRRSQRAKGGGVGKTASLFAALGDETRLRLITVLCAGAPVSITQLTTGTKITRQAVTKHLHVLAGAGLVRDVKIGRERLWQFESDQLHVARQALDMIAGEWDSALAKLKAAVEG